MRFPTMFIPHGAGPCFFMEWPFGPPDQFDDLEQFLRSLPTLVPEAPRAVLVVSGHWECDVPTVSTNPAPSMLYDYKGAPPHCYELEWPAPGAPDVAARVRELLDAAGIESAEDSERGFDHGTFVPMLLAWPDAEVPTVQLSIRADLDPAAHLEIGRAIAPLRDEGVLVIGSGSSFHNSKPNPGTSAAASEWDEWLKSACTAGTEEREEHLQRWEQAPNARECHPREEHLIPLMVVAGAAGEDPGKVIFEGEIFGAALSAVGFGELG